MLIQTLFLLIPLSAAWVVPPYFLHTHEDQDVGCSNFTYEAWLELHPQPILYNDISLDLSDADSHEKEAKLVPEAEEVLDYVEPEGVADDDYDPDDSEDLDEYLDNEVERFKRELPEEDSASEGQDSSEEGSELSSEEGSEPSSEEGLKSSEEEADNVGGEVQDSDERSSEEVTKFFADLKFRQRGRGKNLMVSPGKIARVTLENNHNKAPMNFFIVVTPFEDYEDSGTFGENPEFSKIRHGCSCSKCREKHHHHHHRVHDETNANLTNVHNHDHDHAHSHAHDHEHGHDNEHGHDHEHRHDHGHNHAHSHGDSHENEIDEYGRDDKHANEPDDHANHDLAHGHNHHHEHHHTHGESHENEQVDESVNEPQVTDEVSSEEKNDNPENAEEENIFGIGVIDLRFKFESPANTTNATIISNRRKVVEPVRGDVTACAHVVQGWMEEGSKVKVDFMPPESGCFVIKAYVSYHLNDEAGGGSLVLLPQEYQEHLQHFDCVEPNHIEDEEFTDEEEVIDLEGLSIDAGEVDDSEETPYNFRPRRTKRNERITNRRERKRNKQRVRNERRRNRQNRRRNRIESSTEDENESEEPETPRRFRNRHILKNYTSPADKFCCKEGILHKKASATGTEDQPAPSLSCSSVPTEVTTWGSHRHGAEELTCRQNYTHCCLIFDVEMWKKWKEEREAKRANRRNKKRKNRRNKRNMRFN